MKILVSLFAFMAALVGGAQTPNGPQTNVTAAKVTAARVNHPIQAQQNSGGVASPLVSLELPKPNEIVKGKVTYSGILVTAAKTGHPLQMLNPLAPPEYGLPEDNTVRDPATGRGIGLKFFALKF
jgi:hypothetical protein